MPKSRYKQPAEVQSLLFDRDFFTPGQAKAWARKQGFKYGSIDDSRQKIRLQQFPTEEAVSGSWGTKTIRTGVQAVFAGRRNPLYTREYLSKLTVKELRRIWNSQDRQSYVESLEPRKKEGWIRAILSFQERRVNPGNQKSSIVNCQSSIKNPPLAPVYLLKDSAGHETVIQARSDAQAIKAFDQAVAQTGERGTLYRALPSISAGVKQKVKLIPIAGNPKLRRNRPAPGAPRSVWREWAADMCEEARRQRVSKKITPVEAGYVCQEAQRIARRRGT